RLESDVLWNNPPPPGCFCFDRVDFGALFCQFCASVFAFSLFWYRRFMILLAFLLIMVLVSIEYIFWLRPFLYPSEEDLYKLIKLLVERISELYESEGLPTDSTEKEDDEGVIAGNYIVESTLNDLIMETQTHGTEGTKGDVSINKTNKDESSSKREGFIKDELNCVLNEKELLEGQVDVGRGLFGNEENRAHTRDGHLTAVKQNEKELIDEVTARTSELEHLEQELELMKEAAEIAFNNQHSVDYYLDQLNEQVQAKRNYLLTLESEDTVRKPLEERKRSLEESLYSNNPDTIEMLQKLREMQQEEQFILSEIMKREKEHLKLSADLEKQQKVASRKSHTDRINEITKNSRKQDADIERILKDTREVQLESNSIQERLHRTYTVVDEIIFREAKKDPTGLQVYRLLVSIHKGFEQISEKILATDRIRREVAEYETKLAATASRSLDLISIPLLRKMNSLNNIFRNSFEIGSHYFQKLKLILRPILGNNTLENSYRTSSNLNFLQGNLGIYGLSGIQTSFTFGSCKHLSMDKVELASEKSGMIVKRMNERILIIKRT
ncbi:Coiled-coil domain-containing protein 22-like protein, partial [Mucuna pruriens]